MLLSLKSTRITGTTKERELNQSWERHNLISPCRKAISTSLRTFHSKTSSQDGFLIKILLLTLFGEQKQLATGCTFPLRSNRTIPWNAWDISTALFPILHLVCNQTKQHGIHGGKYFLKSPGNVISETLIFKLFLDAPALKKLVTFVRVPKPPTIHYHPAT